MSNGWPMWRRAFDRAERTVGRPLEQLVGTRRFADALVIAFRAQGAVYDAFERQTRAVLHFWNIPAGTDIRRLNRQIAALTHEVRDLAARLESENELRR